MGLTATEALETEDAADVALAERLQREDDEHADEGGGTSNRADLKSGREDDEHADEGGGTSNSGVVSAHKQNTILKLIARHWQGRLNKDMLAKRLDPEIWAAIESATNREEMLRRAKTATNKVLKGLRLEKHAQRRGDRACQGQGLLDKYGLLAAMAPNIPEEECWRPDWVCELPKPCIPEFNCFPLRGYFDRRDWTLLKRELAKLHEKRRQIEYLVGLVLAKLDVRRAAGLPSKEIVDFAGGRGDLALALGWVLHNRGLGERLTVVELKREYVAQGQRRVQEAGLSGSVRFLEQDLRTYDEQFDLAVACHACGGLIDLILAKCIAAKKLRPAPSFVLLTCCFGKIRRQVETFGLRIPSSGGTAVETQADFWALCGLADSAKPRESTMAMRVLNSDRVAVCRRAGIWVDLRSIPREVTNKNIVLSDAVQPDNSSCVPCLTPATPVTLVPRPVKSTWQGFFRVVAISDTHGRHDQIHVPPADLLVHCGDFTRAGEESEVAEFASWLEAQPCTHKVIIAGNHEVTFDSEYFRRDGKRFHSKGRTEGISEKELDATALRCQEILIEKCPSVRILQNEEIKVGPVRIWGSPCQGSFFTGHTTGAFTLPAACPETEAPWAAISEGVDIVMTHGPPFGIADLSGEKSPAPQHAGCPLLRDHIRRARPLVHFFGHIHEGYGAACTQDDGVLFVNASMCTERYLATRLAVVVDLPLQDLAPEGGIDQKPIDRSRRPDLWLAPRPAADEAPDGVLASTAVASGTKGQAVHADASSDVPLPLYDRLVTALHGHPRLHAVSGTSGYRNKASYLMGADFPGENPMCDPALNKVAAQLQSLALQAESSSSNVEWVEAQLKLTRTGSVGVKLLLRGFRPGSEPEWLPEFLRVCPEVVSVSGQLCPEGSKEKPAKSPWDPRYVDPFPIHGPLYIIEEAPPANGRSGVPFRLSPDAFSEVNSPAEDAMFERVVNWVKPLRASCPRLALQGRNSGFYGLALQREFAFEEVRGCTHCPQTCGDAQASIAMHASEPWLPGGEATFKMSLIAKTGFAEEIRALVGGPPVVMHVTNNRHGLKSEVIRALKETEVVRAVVYNSCNHQCLAREWAELCAGGFEIAEFASADLLAGTEFDSSIFLLLRRPRTLILPIGPPASGKSALARGLSSAGASWEARSDGAQGDKGRSPAGSISREVVKVFERDRIFAGERTGPGGLRGAKMRTHAALLDALEKARGQTSAALYVDSTNGARSARRAYQEALQPDRTVYILLGLDELLERPQSAEKDVLDRILARHRSAGCPLHETRQWEDAVRDGIGPKIARLLAAVESPGSDEITGDDTVVLRCRKMPSRSDLEGLLWHLFLLVCCPALLRVEAPEGFDTHDPHPMTGLPTPGGQNRVALCFLTSARALPHAAADACLDAQAGPLWNDAAWQMLATDFETRTGGPLEGAFCLLRHDDSRESSDPANSFLARAAAVPHVATKRATISLVLAELRLLRAALEHGCEYVVLLSGSCLPLCKLDELRDALLRSEKSIVQYHFCRGGHQRLFNIRYGALQWKAWHRQEAAALAALDESMLLKRWQGMEEGLQRYNLAPDEVVLINELSERLGQTELEARCERRATTFVEWEENLASENSAEALCAGPRRARTFVDGPPEAAWAAAHAGPNSLAPLFCRKVAPMSRTALEAWYERLGSLRPQ